jgi:large subunit ribosomal protein L17
LKHHQITQAKVGDLPNRRLAGAVIRDKAALTKLFEILGPRYKERPGGFTRVMRLQRQRTSDSAEMSLIELVDRVGELRTARSVGAKSEKAGVKPIVIDQVAFLKSMKP